VDLVVDSPSFERAALVISASLEIDEAMIVRLVLCYLALDCRAGGEQTTKIRTVTSDLA
jgi:hypothetical protein